MLFTTDFQLDGSKLSLTNPISASHPLSVSGGNVSLNFETGDFQLSASNKLELKNDPILTASNPLSVAAGNISLDFEATDFKLSASNKLELKNDPVLTASNPLSVAAGNVSLNFETGDFKLSSGNKLELKNDPVLTASNPLSVAAGNVSLTTNDDYLVNSSANKLEFAPQMNGKTLYYSESDDRYYLILRPTDFMNDNDSSGYNRCVIADTGRDGAVQCFAGTQYYAMFDIPHGFSFTGFRVNLVNSAGTPQGTIASSIFYCRPATKTISGVFSYLNTTGGSAYAPYNTHNEYDMVSSGYVSGTTTKSTLSSVKFMAIMCYRNPWTSSFYNQGGYVEFKKGLP